MITWMQRHKKWLIITMWISVIAFIGASATNWGQSNYGDKAGAVAKVGEIKISQADFQKAYSNLYAKYNQAFQGNFDEEKAKQFGLDKQALQQLVQQALLLNLANSYDITVSDDEVVEILKSQKAFYKNDLFDSETYKQVLSQNRLTPTEYEKEIKKELLIQKTLELLPLQVSANEKNIISSIANIADKINYKLISLNDIKIDINDKELKSYWETKKSNFMSDTVYEVGYVKQTPIQNKYDDAKISQYYQDNKMHFKGNDGKILPLESAKEKVIQELDKKATKDQSLRTYIAYKKDKLDANTTILNAAISKSTNLFGKEALESISKLSSAAPFMKPLLIGNDYYIFKLIKTTPSQVKTFEEAKQDVMPLYLEDMKKQKIAELAKNSLANFSGKTTDFITANAVESLKDLNKVDARDFLQKLFVSDKKKSFIILNSGNVVLYNILEQKMLTNTNEKLGNEIQKIKSALFNEGLIKKLQEKYQTEIFVKGL